MGSVSRPVTWYDQPTEQSYQAHLTQADLKLLIDKGLLHAVRRTKGGQVTEYEFTHLLRLLLERA